MDTREKILSPEAAAQRAAEVRDQGRGIVLITGYFDPLLAAHAVRLGEIASQSAGARLVLLDSPPNPLMPLGARAELVAGLEVVDFVTYSEQQSLEELIQSIPHDEIIREQARDEQRTEDLIRHVLNRHLEQ